MSNSLRPHELQHTRPPQTLGKAQKMQGSELPTREHCHWQGYKAPSSALSTVKTKGFPPSNKSLSKDSLRMLCPDGLQAQNCKLSKVGIPKEPEKKSSLALLHLEKCAVQGSREGDFIAIFELLNTVPILSDSLQPHGPQHARIPCPSLSAGVCSNS